MLVRSGLFRGHGVRAQALSLRGAAPSHRTEPERARPESSVCAVKTTLRTRGDKALVTFGRHIDFLARVLAANALLLGARAWYGVQAGLR